MSFILEASHIHKVFGDFEALKDVSISVPKGKIYGLLGPNGAGKTTLIRTLTQITAPDKGQITFDGAPLASHHIASFGYLPEERGLYRKMKVWEQAMYLTRIKGLEKQRAYENLTDWFDRLGMNTWRNKRVEELSKGMQQKLQFVITVAPDPQILILDEPFSGFDPVNTEELKNEILELRDKGTTIIFSTHNMSSVEELCENIALINKGEKVLEGEVDTIRTSFSKSLFSVRFKGSKVAFANALGYQFELIDINETENISKSIVKAHDEATGNDLIRGLINHVEVIAYQEQIPSMHDIFLDAVNPQPQVTEEDGA